MYPFPVFGDPHGADVSFDQTSVTIEAHSTVNITATIHPPTEYYQDDDIRLPVYGGYISITCDDSGKVSHVPFLGAASDMYQLPVQTYDPFYWKHFITGVGAHPDWRHCIMWRDGEILNGTGEAWLQMYMNSRMGSQLIDAFIVTKEWNETDMVWPPVEGENRFVGRIIGDRNGEFPVYNAPRTNYTNGGDSFWDNWMGRKLANGSILANGDYRLVVRQLKHFAYDLTDSESWWSHHSPWFTVNF
ncbi:unnamed protein product [Ambrosiozyma monospora]|uniref:Unnamed protein product n=1 Tax=Ambrosiozyma monospora TaxID=43982 RepID=A0ACB5T8N6_AMBMO|nr:unnamed protein product [Ambrosiozyma monospora]